MSESHGSAGVFAQLSRELRAEAEEPVQLGAVCERAVDIVPACDFASITLRRRRQQLETMAATHETASVCDVLQYELEEGPCVEAVWSADHYLSADVGADPRWPTWGARVAELGVGSLLAIQLSSGSDTIGALNLYAWPTHAFTRDDVDLAVIFSVHAADAISSARLVSGLETAVKTRHLIGAAQGILMNRYDLDLQQAFEVLRRYSSVHNVKLRQVAEYVVHHRGLPDSDQGPGPTR